MKILLTLLLLCSAASAGAAGLGPYREVARGLLKSAAGADKKIGVANFTGGKYGRGEVSDWGLVLRENNKFIGMCGFVWRPPQDGRFS